MSSPPDIDAFLGILLADHPPAAVQAVIDFYEDRRSAIATVEELLMPSLRVVGSRWADEEMTIAEEQLCSQQIAFCLSALRRHATRSRSHGGYAIVACVEGERHTLGSRMIAMLLELDGWDVDMLGSSVSCDALLEAVAKRHPQLVAVSSTRVETIEALRACVFALLELEPRPTILAGGSSTWALEHPKWSVPKEVIRVRSAREAIQAARDVIVRSFTQPEDALLRRYIGRQIQALRDDHGLTPRDLAETTGIPLRRIVRIERGSATTMTTLVQIAEAFDVPIAELFPAADEPQPDLP